MDKNTTNYPPIQHPGHQPPSNSPTYDSRQPHTLPPHYSPQQHYGAPTSGFSPQRPPIPINQHQAHILPQTPKDEPIITTCPNCRNSVLTMVEPVVGIVTWIACIGFMFISCCCLPFFIKQFKDCRHRCPKCNYTIAKYCRI